MSEDSDIMMSWLGSSCLDSQVTEQELVAMKTKPFLRKGVYSVHSFVSRAMMPIVCCVLTYTFTSAMSTSTSRYSECQEYRINNPFITVFVESGESKAVRKM